MATNNQIEERLEILLREFTSNTKSQINKLQEDLTDYTRKIIKIQNDVTAQKQRKPKTKDYTDPRKTD